MPDQTWESEEGDFGLQQGQLKKELFKDALNPTSFDRVLARTGAVLQDVVGLDFDGGHQVIEVTQVRRRKQHPKKEGMITAVTVDHLDLRSLFRKKSLNPLLAASKSPL